MLMFKNFGSMIHRRASHKSFSIDNGNFLYDEVLERNNSNDTIEKNFITEALN